MQPPPPPEPLYVLRGHRAAVQCTAFFPNCQLLAAGDAEGELKLWNLDSRRVTSSIRAHETHAGILQVACPRSTSSTETPIVISQGRDGVVKCWPVHSGSSLSSEPIQVLHSGSYNFCKFALLQPGQTSSSCSISDGVTGTDRQATVGGADETGLQAVHGFQPADCAAAASEEPSGHLNQQHQQPPSGREGLLAQQLRQYQQQQNDAATEVSIQPPHPADIAAPSQAAAAAAAVEAHDPDPNMTDLTEDLEKSLMLGRQQILDLKDASPSSSRNAQAAAAAAGGSDHSSSSGDGAEGQYCWLALPAADAADVGIWQVCCNSGSRNNSSSGDNMGHFSMPEVMLRQERTQQKPSHGLCMAIALLQPQGLTLHAVTGYEDGTIALWDTRNPNKYMTSTRLHSESIMCLAVAGNCKSGLSGSADDALMAFELNIPKGRIAAAQKLTLPGKPGIADVAIRADGRIAASAGWDGKIRIWHAKKRVPLALLKWHSQQVACVSFSGDNKLLAAGGRDNHISMWSLYSPDS